LRLGKVKDLAEAGELPEAMITEEGLSISPVRRMLRFMWIIGEEY